MKCKIYKKIISIIMCLVLSFCNITYNLFYPAICFAKESKQNIRVQDDFYEAVNGEWINKIKLSRGCVSYGTFEEVSNKVTDEIKSIIHNIEINKQNYSPDSEELKVLNLYKEVINTDKRNNYGIQPIQQYLNMTNEINNINDVCELLSNKNFLYFQLFLNLGVGADCKNSKKNILYISESKLGLGNSYYYKNEKIKDTYIRYLTLLNKLSGLNDTESKANAEKFYYIEKSISETIPSKDEESCENNIIEKKYNIYSINKLENEFPNIKLKNILGKLNLSKAKKIIVENPQNLSAMNSLLKDNNIDDIKMYLRTGVLLKSDGLLTEEFRKASSELRNELYGSGTYEINENTGVKFIMYYLDNIIGKIYVNKYFDKDSKKDVENMISEIIENFKMRLNSNSWLSNKTKKMAIKKLNTLNVKIGYPDKWEDCSKLKIKDYNENSNLVEDIASIFNFVYTNEFSKLNKNADKSEWSMAPCSVNAYYNPVNNEIVFPAAILQKPFYDKNNSKEKNYGALGVVIGHELTHAFDNTGSRFDEKGNFNNWWEENDYREFEKRKQHIEQYYSSIITDDGEHINGKLTVGENISDLGGMACALDVIKKMDNPNYSEFFESYANMWREISTKAMKKYLLRNDCHAPKKIRVNQVVSQFEEFYTTYNVKEGDAMYIKKEKRIGVW